MAGVSGLCESVAHVVAGARFACVRLQDRSLPYCSQISRSPLPVIVAALATAAAVHQIAEHRRSVSCISFDMSGVKNGQEGSPPSQGGNGNNHNGNDKGETSRGARIRNLLRRKGSMRKKERLVLAADCGGTTTRLMLYSVDPSEEVVNRKKAPGTLIFQKKYPNYLFGSLVEILQRFFQDASSDYGAELPTPVVACLAVAGVVTQNQCRFTNLDWVVDGDNLASDLGIQRVEVINDFVAQGYGVLTLADKELICLHKARPRHGAPIACIGAGTGLGECFLTVGPTGAYEAYPCEGGHTEFAPRGAGSDETQIELLRYLKIKFSAWNRISVERVVSGKGICNIYEFLAYKSPKQVDKKVHKEFLSKPGDASVVASGASVEGSLCEEALQIFASCYGAQAGTVALSVMPFNGLYLTGGVTQRLQSFLQKDGTFLESYRDKGRVSPMLENIPLYIVKKSDDVGTRGAHLRGVRLLLEHLSGVGPREPEEEHLDKMVLSPPREFVETPRRVELAQLIMEHASKPRGVHVPRTDS